MRAPPRTFAVAGAAACLAALGAPALAARRTRPPPAPAATTGAPAPTPAPAAPAAAGAVILSLLQRVGGGPPFAMVGQRVAVRGRGHAVRGRADGQGELLPRRHEGRGGDRRVLPRPAAPANSASASERTTRASSRPAWPTTRRRSRRSSAGRAPARAATSTRTSGRAPRGQSVRLLQSELSVLHYAVPLNGSSTKAPAGRWSPTAR